MPLDDIHQEWFSRIDHDLQLLAGAFRDMLVELGEESLAQVVPWVNPPGETSHAARAGDAQVDRELQVLSISFQLLNLIEETAAIEARRYSEEKHGVLHEPGLWGEQLLRLRELGFEPERIAQALEEIEVEVVLTAHPTEAKRPVVLRQHRALFETLRLLSEGRWTQREKAALISRVKTQLERLWRTGEMYLYKPDVSYELRNLLDYFRMVFPQAVVALDQRLRDAWEAAGFEPALVAQCSRLPRVTFGDWVGGDRDGHPLVTSAVTWETLQRLRDTALDLHRQALEGLYNSLSLSELYQAAPKFLSRAIEEKAMYMGPEGAAIAEANANEPWRQFVRLMSACLPISGRSASYSYQRPEEMAADLTTLSRSLESVGAKRLGTAEVGPVQRLLDVFGFHTAVLDIRQNSGYHDRALAQLFSAAGIGITDYAEWPEERRSGFIRDELETMRPLAPRGAELGDELRELMDTYEVLAGEIRLNGGASLGALIVSMCRGASDLLGVYVLAREAGLLRHTPEDGTYCLMPVVPLFETGEDLERSPAILEQFLDHPITRATLARQAIPRQQVMVGYSDSNKSSGIFASHWRLHMAQYLLTDIANERGLKLQFFHGRGGTNSRGAGPTHRFMDSLSTNSLTGSLRLTEQGETIAQKYGNVPTATYNLELLLAATAATTLRHKLPYERNQRRIGLGERIADYSERAYRELISMDGFLAFWSQATPIDALEQSFIGSRPARRTGKRTIEDLRAIPWVFSWLQARYYLPAWYGLGSALEQLAREDQESFAFVSESARIWPFMRYVLYNAETSIASADLGIMGDYAQLVESAEIRDKFLKIISEEFLRTEHSINLVFGAPRSERRPRMQATLALREHGLRILHHRQIGLLREWRTHRDAGDSEAASRLVPSLLLSINAIASGERTTG